MNKLFLPNTEGLYSPSYLSFRGVCQNVAWTFNSKHSRSEYRLQLLSSIGESILGRNQNLKKVYIDINFFRLVIALILYRICKN